MKIAYGETYEEAIINRPATGITKKEFWEKFHLIRNHPVVLDYRAVRAASKHEWVRYKRFEVKIVDKTTKQLVIDEKTGKQLKFRSIKQAMKWIWKEDKEIYEKLENLSTKSCSCDGCLKEDGGTNPIEEDLIF